MLDIMVTRRQQHGSGSSSKRNRKSWGTMMKMMVMLTTMMMMTMLVLSASTITSTLEESETNDLNTLEVPNKSANSMQDVTTKQSKPETRQYPFTGFMTPPTSLNPSLAGCPLCDSSVYSYCSHKLIHDSCCCDFPGSTVYQKPPQCAYYDCSLLYAKSCYEHALIKNCCCNNPY